MFERVKILEFKLRGRREKVVNKSNPSINVIKVKQEDVKHFKTVKNVHT